METEGRRGMIMLGYRYIHTISYQPLEALFFLLRTASFELV
jgi:hypothetical protein